MVGPKGKNPVYPAPIQLYGVDLPWVIHSTHLGHKLHQDCTMVMDIRMKRAGFISSSTDIRDLFNFALLRQILSAFSVYSAHLYWAMLCDLFGDMAVSGVQVLEYLRQVGVGCAEVITQLQCGASTSQRHLLSQRENP